MKRLTSIIAAIVCTATLAMAQPSVTAATPNPNAPEIKFKTEFHDFGSVKYNSVTSFDYEFTNTGKEPLILSDVKPQCGCTIPEWPKEPIAPGKSAKIKVSFDTKRVGSHQKTVTVMSNAKTNNVLLSFKINVLPDDSTPVKTDNPAPKSN